MSTSLHKVSSTQAKRIAQIAESPSKIRCFETAIVSSISHSCQQSVYLVSRDQTLYLSLALRGKESGHVVSVPQNFRGSTLHVQLGRGVVFIKSNRKCTRFHFIALFCSLALESSSK